MRPICTRLTFALTAAAFAGCGESHAVPLDKPPAAVVAAGTPLEKPVTAYVEFTRRTDAPESVEVRARVTGFLKKVVFAAGGEADASSSGDTTTQAAEGTEIKAGTPLY